MEGKEVAVLRCDSYDRDLVEERVGEAMDLLGGPESFVREGASVFVKYNALAAREPDAAVTTHPEVVRAVVKKLRTVTPRITIGDSPGGPFNASLLNRTYQKTGVAAIASEMDVELNFDTSVVQKSVFEGDTMKRFTVCKAMDDADHLVSLAKFKTHLFMNVTGAIKNLFGAIPGMTKFTYHAKFSQAHRFASMLVDVVLATEPDFHLIDAIWGMEGNGPQHGDVRKMGVIAAGADAFVLDTLMARIIGTEPNTNRALAAAIDRGLTSGELGEVDVRGDDPDSLLVEGFRLPYKRDISSYVPEVFMGLYGRLATSRPVVNRERCTGCRKCADICPAGAITMADKVAVIDRKKCIRCYCCHELCEYGAIDLKPGLLMHALRLIGE